MDTSKRFNAPSGERGVALVTVLLMMTLVTILVAMALNVSQIEMTLSATNRRTVQGFHAAQAGLDVSFPVIADTIQNNAVGSYGAQVAVNTPTSTPASNNLFLQKLSPGTWSSGVDDTPGTHPNISITAISGQNIGVVVDYEGEALLPGSELENFGARYHQKVGGTGGGMGTLYYVDSLANGPMNSQSEIYGSYYCANC